MKLNKTNAGRNLSAKSDYYIEKTNVSKIPI